MSRSLTFLLLHGGGGPLSIARFAERLSATAPVLTPIHPGFVGGPDPVDIRTPADLAAYHLLALDRADVHDVVVVGFSLGGWVAAEMALSGSPRLRGLVIVNGLGVVVPEHPVANVGAMSPAELAAASYHDPGRFAVDPSTLTDAQRAARATNMGAVLRYGADMVGPRLRERLAELTLPTLVAWGRADRVVTLEYGRAYTAAIPGARFEVVEEAGHMPQLEQPERLAALIESFATA